MITTPLRHPVMPMADAATLRLGADGRHHVSYTFTLPYFGFLWRFWLERRAREIEAAADAGRELPSNVPWWAPPAHQDARTNAAIACICLIAGAIGYGGGTGGLLTQTLPYAAERYGVGDDALGAGLALVRLGVLAALVLAIFVDRSGRRRFIYAGAISHCVLTALVGLAPTYEAYIGGHIALRCLDTALGIALAVLAAEMVPAANRAITLSLVLLSGGVGLALAVGSLPIAAAGEGGFVAVYVLQLLGLPFVLHAGRRLPESPRFLAHEAEPHDYRQLVGPAYRRRLLLVAAASFLSAIFFAPTAEFFNRYLDDEHGFSSFEIVAFLAITGGPSVAMVVIGGRLSDLRNRKGVGVPLVLVATAALTAFYLVDGPLLWITAFIGSMFGAAGLAALAPFDVELFPTRVRSAARAVTLSTGVVGSALGLGLVAVFEGSLGVGGSIAALGVAPVLAASIIWLGFPETTRRELEETSLERTTTLPPGTV